MAPLALLVAGWAWREPPVEADPCGRSGLPEVRDAWLAGLAPEAFIAGCFCAAVALWASAVLRAGKPGPASIACVAVALAVGAAWWAGSEAALAWPFLGLVGLVPSVVVVPGLAVGVLLTHGRVAWRLVRVLAWWSGLILVPGFVAVVAGWGEQLCMS